MPYISSMKRFGQRIGEERGIQIGEAKILTRLLHHRFGTIPDWANKKIAEAEPPSLEAWSLRFVDAQSLDEIFSDKA